jgi:hypothetical protein
MDYLSKPIPVPAIHEVIVPEQDYHTFAISHPDHLKLYASPLATHGTHHIGHTGHAQHHGEAHAHGSVSSGSDHGSPAEQDPDVPVLKRAHEASTIQLFFDLFFVANLTTFTSLHEIDNWQGRSSILFVN